MNVGIYATCAEVNYFTFKWLLEEGNKRIMYLKRGINIQSLRQYK